MGEAVGLDGISPIAGAGNVGQESAAFADLLGMIPSRGQSKPGTRRSSQHHLKDRLADSSRRLNDLTFGKDRNAECKRYWAALKV